MLKFGLLAIYFLPVSVVMVILNIAKPDVDYCGECIDWCSNKSILAYINLGIIVYAIGKLKTVNFLKTGLIMRCLLQGR